ncbi:MAG: alanine--glyoxylate aminotransferase family protein [Longimicrobiales bacterium]
MTGPRDPLLMTPGPTRTPDRVLRAGCRVLHHRTPEFSALLGETLERLAPAFGTADATILPIHATGRAAMEGALDNLFRPGDTVVACCNGKFGAMWAGFAERAGLEVVRVATDWEHSVATSDVDAALAAAPDARAVLVAFSDTSTGVLNPVPDIARVARSHDALILVDAISALGGVPFRMDAWGVDVAVTASQKCLMSGAGLAFAAVGPRAWAASARAGTPRSYWDFEAVRRSLQGPRPETPGTTPVSLVLQVLEALRMLGEEGWDAVFARHRAMAEEARTQALRLGFGLQGTGLADRSATLTALTVPDGTEPARLRAGVLDRGIRVAGGLGPYKDTALRIGHMGDIRMDDVVRTLDALEAALADLRG